MKKMNAFTTGWSQTKTEITINNSGFKSPRNWQKECFDKLKDAKNWLITAPTAAGKTFEILYLNYHKLIENPNLRTIIAVPQTIIASGFAVDKFVYNDEEVDWYAKVCCGESNESHAAEIIQFLKTASGKPHDRTVICTHATLAILHGKNKDLFKNTQVIIDEAHHIQYHEDDEEQVMHNSVGEFIKHACENQNQITLGLTTATFFRGDQLPIIPEKYFPKFTKFSLSWDRFLETCKYLRGFTYDFIVGEFYQDALNELFKEKIGKTIVYLPPVSSPASQGKGQDVLNIVRAIAQNDKLVVSDWSQPIVCVDRNGAKVRIVNLVDEVNREEKKRAIELAHKSDKDDYIDVILALGMFKEGANWKWANREIVIGNRSSLTEVGQIIGRLFRDAPGKEIVEITQIFPFKFDQLDKEAFRVNLNEFMKTILMNMILEELVNPIKVKIPEPRNGLPTSTQVPVDSFEDLDVIKNIQIQKEIVNQVLEAIEYDPSLMIDNSNFKVKFQEIVSDVLEDYEVDSDHEAMTEQLWKQWIRRSLAVKGISTENIDFDIVTEFPLNFLLAYTSNVCDIKTFQRLRDAIDGSTSIEKKRQLLEMARKGEDRPNTRTILGSALSCYTSGKKDTYDSSFNEQIRKIRPDWFFMPLDIRIKLLLEIADNNTEKPTRNRSSDPNSEEYMLAWSLSEMTRKKSSMYNAEFDMIIRKKRPDWFTYKKINHKEIKKQLLDLAKNNKNKPLQTGDETDKFLAKSLSSYTCEKSKNFDIEFFEELKFIKPEWLVSRSDLAIEKKLNLIEMAQTGKDKPLQNTILGTAFKNYTQSKTARDDEFTNKILKIRPDWFYSVSHQSDINKNQILKMIETGEERPNYKTHPSLYNALHNYTNPDGSAFDLEFMRFIEKTKPEWLIDPRSIVADDKKNKLIQMALNKQFKPKTRSILGTALATYTRSKSASYDPEFTKQIKELAPHWFK